MTQRNMVCAGLVAVIMTVVAADAHAFFWQKKEKEETKESVQQPAAPVAPAAKAPEKQMKPAAAEKKTEAPAAKPAVVEKKAEVALPAPQPADPDVEKARQQRKAWKEKLNNTSWTIDVVPLSGGNKQADTLMFEDNKVYSKNNKKNGFAPTNYTLSMKNDTTAVWETMQTAENGEIMFWRGEVFDDGQTMRGVVSHQLPAGTSTDYSFVAKDKKAIQQ